MCGIAGLVSRDPAVTMRQSVLDRLRHRGPDSEKIERFQGASSHWELAHSRLAINDLSPAGDQPIANEDGSLVLNFNGEIYNSPELRRYCETHGHRFRSTMDGEVILHLFEMEGTKAFARLNGIFAFALANTLTGEVVLARDPLGVKPLFISKTADTLWFASELAALSAAGAPLGEKDTVALAQFLTFLWIPGPRTPYLAAESLAPGHALSWRPVGIEVIRYTAPLFAEPDPGPVDENGLVDEATGRIEEACRRQLLSDVPIGLMASGGVDSGLLWWATKDRLAKAYTITWDVDKGAERLDEDTSTVRELEQLFATDVRYLAGESSNDELVPPSGDLFADPAYELTHLISSAARGDGFKVLLSGQGGDELFAGYRRHSVARWLDRGLDVVGRAGSPLLRHLPGRPLAKEYAMRVMRALSEGDPFDGYMQLCTYSSAGERARVLGCTEEEVSDQVVWSTHREVYDQQPKNISFLRKAMALDLNVYLPGLGLAYVDRAGMRSSIEIRVPWLDLELVRWTLQLSDAALMKRGRGKWLTREVAARNLSPRMAHRPKRGFAAPIERVNLGLDERGTRGFRQGSYFAYASRILERFMGSGSINGSSPPG